MAEQEDLDDLLADVPDLSVREAEEALRAAGKSGSLEEIVAVLEEADEALKELQTDVKAMRRRNDKARGMDAAMRKARAAADKQAAKAAKPARSVRREDTLVAFIAEASALSVAAAENELVAAESADTMVELDQHLGRAEVELAALLAIIKAPALPSDAGLSISPNGIIERRIVWNLLTKLSLAGFVVECVDDGGDLIECDGDAMKAMEAVFSVDESRVYVRKPGGSPRWIFLVGGNGEDMISDHGNPDGDPDGFVAFMDAFKPEENF